VHLLVRELYTKWSVTVKNMITSQLDEPVLISVIGGEGGGGQSGVVHIQLNF